MMLRDSDKNEYRSRRTTRLRGSTRLRGLVNILESSTGEGGVPMPAMRLALYSNKS
jgi:hypothetical protein